MTAPARLRAMVILIGALAGCSSPDEGEAGCQASVQQQLPGSALTLLPDAQLLMADEGRFVLAGMDGAAVRWMTIAPDGSVGTEAVVPLPAAAALPALALAGGAGSGLDTLLIGFVIPSDDDLSGELHFIRAPLDGLPSTMGPAALTFPGQPNGPARLALGSPKPRPAGSPQQAMNAAVAWVDTKPAVMLAFVDSGGSVASGPILVEDVQSIDCLAVTGDTIDPTAGFLVSFLRPSEDSLTTSWEEGEVWIDGSVRTSAAGVAEGNRSMGCALGTPTSGNDYSFAWQDSSGSWLSVLSGRTIDALGNISNNGNVESHPFVAATDFGGPDVQPPIVGFAAVGRGGAGLFVGDYMLAFPRPRDVEIWRLNWKGERRPGALILPSAQGNLGGVSSVNTGAGLALTYADYGSSTNSTTTGSRWLVNAVCY